MNSTPLAGVHRMVWMSLMAALVAVGAYLQFPLGPVPFSMQPFFVFLAGFALGPLYGPGSVALYVGTGLVGLPVFAGGKSGIAVLLGPTGGYLFGFVAAAALCGLAVSRKEDGLDWKRGILWGALALIATYAVGLLQLRAVLDFTWGKALAVGFFPFIGQDVVKLALAVGAARFLRKRRLLPL